MEMGSWIRRMFEEGIEMRRRFGDENVFDLSIGCPTLEPPVEFKRELKRLVDNPLLGCTGICRMPAIQKPVKR